MLLSHKNFQTIGVSEASRIDYAVNLTINNVQYTTYKSLSEEESQNSSTWRDISAIGFALKAFVHLLKNSSVLWKTDNHASTFISSTSSPLAIKMIYKKQRKTYFISLKGKVLP